MKDEKKPVPFGAGHVAAMGRLGLHELRATLYPESNIAQPNEYGLFGNATPGEVAEARRPDAGRSPNGPGSILNDVMAQAVDRSAERQQRERSMEPER